MAGPIRGIQQVDMMATISLMLLLLLMDRT